MAASALLGRTLAWESLIGQGRETNLGCVHQHKTIRAKGMGHGKYVVAGACLPKYFCGDCGRTYVAAVAHRAPEHFRQSLLQPERTWMQIVRQWCQRLESFFGMWCFDSRWPGTEIRLWNKRRLRLGVWLDAGFCLLIEIFWDYKLHDMTCCILMEWKIAFPFISRAQEMQTLGALPHVEITNANCIRR